MGPKDIMTKYLCTCPSWSPTNNA